MNHGQQMRDDDVAPGILVRVDDDTLDTHEFVGTIDSVDGKDVYVLFRGQRQAGRNRFYARQLRFEQCRILVETHRMVDATCADCARPCSSSVEDANTGVTICEPCARSYA
jgi:hypothetical protein